VILVVDGPGGDSTMPETKTGGTSQTIYPHHVTRTDENNWCAKKSKIRGTDPAACLPGTLRNHSVIHINDANASAALVSHRSSTCRCGPQRSVQSRRNRQQATGHQRKYSRARKELEN
jgi:hypothetical protein